MTNGMGRLGRLGKMGRKSWTVGAGWILLLPVLSFLPVQPLFAQSPNTSTIVVLVTDQQGAMVTDAAITVTNNQTGAVRAVVSGADGSATVPALSLTGTYTVAVAKQGDNLLETTTPGSRLQ